MTTTITEVRRLEKIYRAAQAAYCDAYRVMIERRSVQLLPPRVTLQDAGTIVSVLVDGTLVGTFDAARLPSCTCDTHEVKIKKAVWHVLDCCGRSEDLEC